MNLGKVNRLARTDRLADIIGVIGRTDFPCGNCEVLINSIKQKLLILPPETICYPGHGAQTTIAQEKKYNPFLQ